MKFTIKTTKIKKLLSIAKKFIYKKSWLQILECVVMELIWDNLVIKSTNMDHRQIITVKWIEGDAWHIVCDIYDLIRSIKYIQSPEVIISKDDSWKVYIESSDQLFEISRSYPKEEYVALYDGELTNHYTIKRDDLMNWIKYTKFSILPKNFSPVFTCMYMYTKKDDTWSHIIFAGTDSYRLSEYKVTVDDVKNDYKLLIPYNLLDWLMEVLEYIKSDNVYMWISEKIVSFEYTNDDYFVKIWSLLTKWNYPEYDNERIIPKEYSWSILFNRSDIKKVMTVINAIWRDNNFATDIDNSVDWKTTIATSCLDKCNYKTKVLTSITGNTDKFCINWSHLLWYINLTKSDTIKISHNWSTWPILVTSEDKCHKYIIKPLKW